MSYYQLFALLPVGLVSLIGMAIPKAYPFFLTLGTILLLHQLFCSVMFIMEIV